MAIPTATATNVRHALNRWTFGPTAALTAQVTKSGLGAYLESQLAEWRSPDPTAEAAVAGLPMLGSSTAELAAYSPEGAWAIADELQTATIVRATFGSHQLYERMVEFWTDHFAIDLAADDQWFLKPAHDREVIRKFALGRFEDLLIMSSASPAMLHFLDQTKSTAGNPNENFARELLELHTLGVDGGYDETDVKETARLLTGWSFDRQTFAFSFRNSLHDPAPATILGKTYGGSGPVGGVALLKDLAHHPATARFLALKLCRRFVSDDPSPTLVSSVASAYLAADTDIAATLRHLFNHSEFWGSAEKKHRRPIDAMVAFLRATATQPIVTDAEYWTALWYRRYFVTAFELLGQAPMRWLDPDGYPDSAAAWIHPMGLLARWNAFLAIVQDLVGIGVAKAFGLHPLFGIAAGSSTLAGGPATGLAFAPLLEQAGLAGAASIAMASAMAGIVLGSILGAPLATMLIERHRLVRTSSEVDAPAAQIGSATMVDGGSETERIQRTLKHIVLLLVAMGVGAWISDGVHALGVTLPSYTGAMLVGALIRNLDDGFGWFRLSMPSIEGIGSICLSLFISVALMDLHLWELAGMATPLLVDLALQTAIVVAFCCWPLLRLMGRDYDAAVITGGFAGFMLGITANAMAVMDSLVERFGPAPRAFLVAPLVGAFLIDFTNAIVITFFINGWK